MTLQEFDLEFDALYNNISSNQAPGLNAYEKSIFLTQAQEAIVVGIYNGSLGGPFEGNEEAITYLAPLVEQSVLTELKEGGDKSFGGSSKFVSLPEDIWFKTGETAVIQDNTLVCGDTGERTVDVVPVTQDDWYRTINSPFRTSNERRVLRMDPAGNTVELYSKYPIIKYIVRYLRKPKPIILENLTDGLTINGEFGPSECELNPVLHRPILKAAVELAKAAWAA